jgi:hypothetical protein
MFDGVPDFTLHRRCAAVYNIKLNSAEDKSLPTKDCGPCSMQYKILQANSGQRPPKPYLTSRGGEPLGGRQRAGSAACVQSGVLHFVTAHVELPRHRVHARLQQTQRLPNHTVASVCVCEWVFSTCDIVISARVTWAPYSISALSPR